MIKYNQQKKGRTEMKRKYLKYVLATIAIIVLFLIVGRIGWYETHTIRIGSIKEVIKDTILFEDAEGYDWIFIGEGYQVNDIVEVTFWNSTTKAIEDDEIERVKIIKK